MSAYLLVSEGVAPLDDTDAASCAAGLGGALVAGGHQVTILTLAAPERAAAVPGFARRLRKVAVSAGDGALELPLFEGRSALSPAQIVVIGANPGHRAETCALLGTAAASMVSDGLLKADVVIGWGETSAMALAAIPAPTRFFVLTTGSIGAPLSEDEMRVVGPTATDDATVGHSLVARGVIASTGIVVPSPTSARAIGDHADLALRPSDEPLIAARFGCDEPPFDPASDPVLAATYSAEAPSGKLECRRALVRQTSLAVGARTLLLTTPPLREAEGGRRILHALARLTDEDVAIAISSGGERALIDHANVLAIEHAGKIAVLKDVDAGRQRQLLAGADALLLADEQSTTARAAGVALRYGTLPIAPEAGAHADLLVDYDPGSATGSALLYQGADPLELLGAIRRAASLRSSAELWAPLVKALLLASPRWSATAELLASLTEHAGPS